MACCNESVHAHTAAHDVVGNSVDEWVRGFRFREFHVRIVDRFQSCIQEKLVVEKV
jgi:hypothetical protein